MATYKVSLDKAWDADLRGYCQLTTGRQGPLNPFVTELVKCCVVSYRTSKADLADVGYLGHHEDDREEGRRSWRRYRGRKLSETQVKRLTRLYVGGMPVRALARRFAVGESNVLRCLRRAGVKLP